MKIKFTFLFVLSVALVWGGFPSQAREIAEGLSIGGYFKNETYVRPWHGPDDIMSCRNVLNVDLNYDVPPNVSFFRRFFIQLRPFYDAVFDLENEGTGGANSSRIPPGSIITLPPLQGRHIREKYQDNFGVADDWDPLLRECWVDIKIGKKFDARLGRQIVSWGRSDGIYLLDLINPFNFRNWAVFEEEDTKIPLWMVNLTYSFTGFNNLQLLVIPRYVPEFDAADGHDWAANVTNYVREFYADPGAFFGMPGAFGQTQVKFHEPDSGDPGDWTWGVRWGGIFKEITYSLNALYTWSQIPNDWPQDPYGMVYVREPNRMMIFGGSFDYMFDYILGMKSNLVVRGEVAYFRHGVYVDGNGINHKKQRIDYMLGFDKYFFVNYWASLQIKQSWIVNPPSWNNCYLGAGTRLEKLLTIPDVGTFPIVEGFRDAQETQISLYIMKPFLPGKTLNTELFVLWGDEGEWWIRPKARYEVTDHFYASIGFNIYQGHKEDTFGQFHDNDNIFWEFKYDF